jgi:hypothetical protein
MNMIQKEGRISKEVTRGYAVRDGEWRWVKGRGEDGEGRGNFDFGILKKSNRISRL